MRELSRSRSVDALSKPIFSGSGTARTVVFPRGEMTDHRELVSEVIHLIKDRVAAKCSKRYASDVTLVVGFYDGLFDSGDLAEFRVAYDSITHPSQELYFVGVQGRILVPKRRMALRD